MRGILLGAVLALASVEAQATTYCYSGHHRIYDGDTLKIDWKMTAAANRQKLTPMQEKPTAWCNFSWNALGGFNRPIAIVTAPKLNEARVSQRYRISYHAQKLGTDSFTAKLYWVDRFNKENSATLIYNVEVVDHAL
ncbi:hypothetical protein GCM10007036_10110 [Alsobacter metallidurans]|uniref:Uncharacterized protein n=1 Tax=Alsobacter metallidurans TaxID=340221 RepID=A0A917MGS5_9HYPH|nr:hypothetical protein [Alsobacter metallidurans]GGH12356.1 hypothetical protein GCM10007036_10110 [Alsobacter metallidurans]